MRILLFGKNGQVGWELQRALAPLAEVVALGSDSPAPLAADFRRPEELSRTVHCVAPQVIVNAAAYTAVDEAQTHPVLAHTINAAAPGQLARLAAAAGAWLVHYSSDQVFDGSGDVPWTEDAATAALNVYGRSKLDGELAIRASGCRHLILRSSWIHAARGDNFMRRILRLAAERDQLDVVADQCGAPTGAELLADVTAHVLRGVLADPARGGTYHVAAAGQTHRQAYARHVVAFARAHGAALRLQPDGVRPICSSEHRAAAPRPLNSRLDTRKLRATFELVLPDWQSGVERTLRELLG